MKKKRGGGGWGGGGGGGTRIPGAYRGDGIGPVPLGGAAGLGADRTQGKARHPRNGPLPWQHERRRRAIGPIAARRTWKKQGSPARWDLRGGFGKRACLPGHDDRRGDGEGH